MQTSEDWILNHDDFEDNSLERRGKPCLHRIYGPELAVNAGDALQVIMWKMLWDNNRVVGEKKAQKIAEEFYRPTIVLTKTDGHYKGSARSIPSFHITEFLRSLKKHLVDVGGHAQAAGFTIEEKKLTSFTTTATKLANKLIKDKDLERIIIVDIKIPVSKINLN